MLYRLISSMTLLSVLLLPCPVAVSASLTLSQRTCFQKAIAKRTDALLKTQSDLSTAQLHALNKRKDSELAALLLVDNAKRQQEFVAAAAVYVKEYNAANFQYGLGKQSAWDTYVSDSRYCQ